MSGRSPAKALGSIAAKSDEGRAPHATIGQVAKLHDISVPINAGMHVYDGNPGFRLELVDSIAAGATANVSRLDLGVHTGTHVDAPVHFLEGGAGTESLDLETLVGPASVVDATAAARDLDAETLGELAFPDDVTRILFKTSNSRLWNRDSFSRDFVRFTGSGARFLIDRGVRLVGIDYLSIGDAEAHQELLGARVIALEGLDLREVDPGNYELICLPLRLEGSDGAPARVILRVPNG
jgi:arylformamidase